MDDINLEKWFQCSISKLCLCNFTINLFFFFFFCNHLTINARTIYFGINIVHKNTERKKDFEAQNNLLRLNVLDEALETK